MKPKILWLGASLLLAASLMACEKDQTPSNTKPLAPSKATDVADKSAEPVSKPTPKVADKKSPDAKPEAVECQKDKGCPPQEKLEACPVDLVARPFIEGLDKRNPIASGTSVALSGPLLQDAACTEVACDQACCNTCSGKVMLGASSSEALVLLDEKNPKRFHISGDETMVCSPFPDGEVVVQGEFAIVNGEYGIKNPTFCKRR